tara:strand:- start:34 stop:138 length:105 start_codon:yes stop_codon:yes gene_type:complete
MIKPIHPMAALLFLILGYLIYRWLKSIEELGGLD